MFLPIAMVALDILFVGLASWRSRVGQIPGWGSHALADVVYAGEVGLDLSSASKKDGPVERPEAMLRASKLERWAEGKTARLRFTVKGGQGWI